MQSHFKKFLLILGFLSLPYTIATAAPETFTFDTHHSFVQWHANHFGFSNPSGKWPAEGTLELDVEKPENSKVTATIQVAKIITGIPEFDNHLQSKSFLDVASFPTATFVSNKVTITGKETADVQGILTLHGTAKPVTLNVKLNRLATNPISNKLTAGFTATTELKRSEFGINTLIPGVSDQVQIAIEVEAYKAGPS